MGIIVTARKSIITTTPRHRIEKNPMYTAANNNVIHSHSITFRVSSLLADVGARRELEIEQ